MSRFFHIFRQTLFPLFLILVCPPTVFLMIYINTELGGSLKELFSIILEKGLFNTLKQAWIPYFFGSAIAWKILSAFSLFQLLLMKFLPGKLFSGPPTPAGHVPVYKANGPLAFGITLATFYLLAFQWNFFSPTIIYDHFPELLGALNLFSFCFCILLVIKGYFAPPSKDAGGSGNLIFDFYWGTELYPRIFGWDVKQFTNCRFGMMSWSLIILSFAAKQQQLYGLSDSMVVSVVLQLVYITKFFFWETGYFRSLDIMHDRAGYYICWGCLVWVPAIYTSPSLYLVNHPHHLGLFLSFLITLVGCTAILINFGADKQRQKIRETKGNCLIWGKPPRYTVAYYTTSAGEVQSSLLLSSGWWGIARHFHYVPEIVGAFCWTVPALFSHAIPYFYVVFLTILLIDRAFRDDIRCAQKYEKGWSTYCEQVPYKIIPYVI